MTLYHACCRIEISENKSNMCNEDYNAFFFEIHLQGLFSHIPSICFCSMRLSQSTTASASPRITAVETLMQVQSSFNSAYVEVP